METITNSFPQQRVMIGRVAVSYTHLHLNASGGEFYGTMDEAREVFERALEKYSEQLTIDN